MFNYTRIIGKTSTNIRTPTVAEIAQGNNQLTIFESRKNNGYLNEVSQQLGDVSTELTNLITDAGLTPDGTLTQVSQAVALLIPSSTATETYSVNKAFTVNGYADYINKVSETSISFDVDSGVSFSPLSLTHPDGTIETLTSLANVTSGLSSNGTYFILKEKGVSTAVITLPTSVITESIIAPSSPTNGDYWLDISQQPYLPYKRVGGVWVVTQFVKLGQVIKTGGILASPISYALNGRYSGEQTTLANGTKYTFDHNLGIRDVVINKYVECKIPDRGYSIGDRVYNNDDGNAGTASSFHGTVVTSNLDNITANLTTGNGAVGTVNKSTGDVNQVFTTANWKAGLTIKRDF
jgi:hypothetical protein